MSSSKKRKMDEEETISSDVEYNKASQELQLECQICLDLPYPPMLLNCGHIICLNCYQKIELKECGYCKSPIGLGLKCYPLKNIIEKHLASEVHLIYPPQNIKEELKQICKIGIQMKVKKIIKHIEDKMKISAQKGYIGYELILDEKRIDTIEIKFDQIGYLVLFELEKRGYILKHKNKKITDIKNFNHGNYPICIYWTESIFDL